MPPQETSGLLPRVGGKRGEYERIEQNLGDDTQQQHAAWSMLPSQFSFGSDGGDSRNNNLAITAHHRRRRMLPLLLAAVVLCASGTYFVNHILRQKHHHDKNVIQAADDDDNNAPAAGGQTQKKLLHKGPYQLLEAHEGKSFLDYYSFYKGADSLGSAGFNTYVSKKRAAEIGIFQVTTDDESSSNGDDQQQHESIILQSAPTKEGPRESIRLEGKRRFDRGLFILDMDHMPAGCGVWPAFWLTDEANWPDNGEIDIVEGVNYQKVAKTALHTSESCSMYAHVPGYSKTGYWDSATGIPNTWTGLPDNNTRVEADNCWVMAPHQWANQGCVAISEKNGTMGAPLNQAGGGVFALEWDPANRYIRSWVFPKSDGIPSNLQESIDTAGSSKNKKDAITKPDTDTWGLPYAYFAIGETTGCSADHFKNMRLVINLAFCGTVSGNRYFTDCPFQAKEYNVKNDPVRSCNAWIQSNPKELDEAYFKIRGVYVYDRE